jgi:ninjurin-2, putative
MPNLVLERKALVSSKLVSCLFVFKQIFFFVFLSIYLKAEEETFVDDRPSLEIDTASGHHHHHLHHIANQMAPDLPKTSNMPLDVNIYATRKTVTQGMMDIALMTANASQLKNILVNANDSRYFTIIVSLITSSLVIQVSFFVVFILHCLMPFYSSLGTCWNTVDNTESLEY